MATSEEISLYQLCRRLPEIEISVLKFISFVERITAILLFRVRITYQKQIYDGCRGPDLFLPQFRILHHFALTPLTNIHHFVIYDLSFWV